MNLYVFIGSAIAIILYFPLWRLLVGKTVQQNLLTWILWSSLDFVVVGTLVSQRGGYELPLIYGAGSFMTAIIIWKAGDKLSWTWFESLVLVLVVISTVIWKVSGDREATIASTAAMVIAGIPQVVDVYKNPRKAPLAIYSGYAIANTFFVLAGSEWSIKERFYPVTAAGFSLLLVVLSCRKFYILKEDCTPV